jgi:hypothetical protein
VLFDTSRLQLMPPAPTRFLPAPQPQFHRRLLLIRGRGEDGKRGREPNLLLPAIFRKTLDGEVSVLPTLPDLQSLPAHKKVGRTVDLTTKIYGLLGRAVLAQMRLSAGPLKGVAPAKAGTHDHWPEIMGFPPCAGTTFLPNALRYPASR